MELARDGALKAQARSVAFWLWSHQDGYRNVSQKAIGQALNISTNATRSALEGLESARWLVRQPIVTGADRTPWAYVFHIRRDGRRFTAEEVADLSVAVVRSTVGRDAEPEGGVSESDTGGVSESDTHRSTWRSAITNTSIVNRGEVQVTDTSARFGISQDDDINSGHSLLSSYVDVDYASEAVVEGEVEGRDTSAGFGIPGVDDGPENARENPHDEPRRIAREESCSKDRGQDTEESGVDKSSSPVEAVEGVNDGSTRVTLMSLEQWALLDAATDVLVAEAARRGWDNPLRVVAVGLEELSPEYRTAEGWVAAVHGLSGVLEDDSPADELSVDDLPVADTGVDAAMVGVLWPRRMLEAVERADDVQLVPVDDFYGRNVGFLAEYLEWRDDIAEDAADEFAYQRAILAGTLYEGDLMTDRGWLRVFVQRDWVVDERDSPQARDAVRARSLEKIRRAQLAMGLQPLHGRPLRARQEALAVALGDLEVEPA